MSKHTPGPWEYNGSSDVKQNNGTGVARVALNGSADEIKSNARLIAAAPDMLEAIEVTLKRFMDDEGYDAVNFEELIAAIAKARGE